MSSFPNPLYQGRQCAKPLDAITVQSARHPFAVSSMFRTPRATAVADAAPTDPDAPARPAPTPVPLDRRPPLSAAAPVSGSWFVEFASPAHADKFLSAVSDRPSFAAAWTARGSALSASLACTATDCVVAAVSSGGHLLWLPVDDISVTSVDIDAYLQVGAPSVPATLGSGCA